MYFQNIIGVKVYDKDGVDVVDLLHRVFPDSVVGCGVEGCYVVEFSSGDCVSFNSVCIRLSEEVHDLRFSVISETELTTIGKDYLVDKFKKVKGVQYEN